jgi:hypothetical protein
MSSLTSAKTCNLGGVISSNRFKKQSTQAFLYGKTYGIAGVIFILFRHNNVKGLLKGRNYSARAVDKDMLGIYGGEGGENQ